MVAPYIEVHWDLLQVLAGIDSDVTQMWHNVSQMSHKNVTFLKSHFCLTEKTVNFWSQPKFFLDWNLVAGVILRLRLSSSIYNWHFFAKTLQHFNSFLLIRCCLSGHFEFDFGLAQQQARAQQREETMCKKGERLCCDGQIREALQTKDFRQV